MRAAIPPTSLADVALAGALVAASAAIKFDESANASTVPARTRKNFLFIFLLTSGGGRETLTN
jgi:hypothetical protein